MYLEHLFRPLSRLRQDLCQWSSTVLNGILGVCNAMHVLSVRPVLARVGNAAVDVSDRRNPEISSRIMIFAHRVPRVVA